MYHDGRIEKTIRRRYGSHPDCIPCWCNDRTGCGCQFLVLATKSDEVEALEDETQRHLGALEDHEKAAAAVAQAEENTRAGRRVEDEAGTVIASRRTPPLTLEPGDTFRRRITLSLPESVARGRYFVRARIDQMQQGMAEARKRPLVIE